jgi:hypothetical protein
VTLAHFLELVARHGSPALPAAEMRARIGTEATSLLRALGWLESRALLEGARYPCSSPGGHGCPRRVLREDGQLVAVCGNSPEECGDIVIAPEDAEVLEVTPPGWRAALADALGLDEREAGEARPEHGGPWRLGGRAFGGARATFYFAQSISRRDAGWQVDLIRLKELDGAIALVVPVASRIGADARAELRRAGFSLLPLDRLLRVEEGPRLRVDLAPFVVERRFEGIDPGGALWPRYDLVLDPDQGRHWYGGASLQLRRRPRTAAMLVELARHPGAVVTRDRLCRVMWPDSYGARGTERTDWDRRIREHKQGLVERMRAAWPEAASPIEAVAAGSDVEGGYRLTVMAGRIAWWSG